MATTKAYHFRAGGGFKETRGCSSLSVARKWAQKIAKRIGHTVTYFFSGGVHHKVKPPKANPCKRKNPKTHRVYWSTSSGPKSRDFSDGKKAQTFAIHQRDLARGVKVGSVKVRRIANPCKRKKPAAKRPGKVNPRIRLMYGTRAQLPKLRKFAHEDADRTGQTVAIVTAEGKKLAVVKPRAKAKRNKPGGELGDWIDVKKGQVRVRKLKGGIVKLDIRN